MIDYLLSDEFLTPYKTQEPPYGFGEFSKAIILTKYSRKKDDGNKEQWWEIVRRNVEGIFQLMNKYTRHNIVIRDQMYRAKMMYDHMFNMRFLPAGRPLRNVGYGEIKENDGAKYNNCSQVDFKDVYGYNLIESFQFILDMSMLGVGVGITIGLGSGQIITKPSSVLSLTFSIPDSREGWVKALGELIKQYITPNSFTIDFVYDEIRAKGEPIKGTGGYHAGYKPLKLMIDNIRKILDNNSSFNPRVISDISNIIAATVISGGQRRSALLLLGDSTDEEFLYLKDKEKYPERIDFEWTSNNSIIGKKGMDYGFIVPMIRDGVDIGIVYLGNYQMYGRMVDDEILELNISGPNPCAEMGLENFELCNLIDININKFTNDNIGEILDCALLYAKIISAVPTHWEQTNKVMEKNRRIGISQTGVIEYLSTNLNDTSTYITNLNKWYAYLKRNDELLSMRLRIRKSVKLTTVKPSGTISKLMGTTAGISYPVSKYLIRRMRFTKGEGYAEYFEHQGLNVIEDIYDKTNNTWVVEFPLAYGDYPTISDVSLRDQMDVAVLLQRYWSDNAVSATFMFEENELPDIHILLQEFESHLKCVTFGRKNIALDYMQVPEEAINENEYHTMVKNIAHRREHLNHVKIEMPDSVAEQFCTTELCEIRDLNNNFK